MFPTVQLFSHIRGIIYKSEATTNMTLETVKNKVRRKYLGEAGIHAIGVRRSQGALCLYVESEEDPELQKVLEQIEKEISPYHVLAIEEEQAKLSKPH